MTQGEPEVYRLDTGVAKGNRTEHLPSDGAIVSGKESKAQIGAYFEGEQARMPRFIRFLEVIFREYIVYIFCCAAGAG